MQNIIYFFSFDFVLKCPSYTYLGKFSPVFSPGFAHDQTHIRHSSLLFSTVFWLAQVWISSVWLMCPVHNAFLTERPLKAKVCYVTQMGGRAAGDSLFFCLYEHLRRWNHKHTLSGQILRLRNPHVNRRTAVTLDRNRPLFSGVLENLSTH